jgi:FkbM family methyltransferase
MIPAGPVVLVTQDKLQGFWGLVQGPKGTSQILHCVQDLRPGISNAQFPNRAYITTSQNKILDTIYKKLVNTIKRHILSSDRFHRVAVLYSAREQLLPEVLTRTRADDLRKMLFLPTSEHAAQLNQDIFALIVNRFQPGYFLEIGANDGYRFSNTVYLEEQFGWDGLLIEANPRYTASLQTRRAKSVVVAIASTAESYEFVDAGLVGGIAQTIDGGFREQREHAARIMVQGAQLEHVLYEHGAPAVIDFVTVDVEGGEVEIVRQMCQMGNRRFRCGCIEHNYREADDLQIRSLLAEAGYRVVWENQTEHDLYFVDDQRVTL